MWSLFAIGLLAGTLFGLRYNVLILVPAILIACALAILATVIGTGILGGVVTPATIGIRAAVISVALQIGYICGAALQHFVLSPRGHALPASTSLPMSARSTSRH